MCLRLQDQRQLQLPQHQQQLDQMCALTSGWRPRIGVKRFHGALGAARATKLMRTTSLTSKSVVNLLGTMSWPARTPLEMAGMGVTSRLDAPAPSGRHARGWRPIARTSLMVTRRTRQSGTRQNPIDLIQAPMRSFTHKRKNIARPFFPGEIK